jgi:hypothetical protein
MAVADSDPKLRLLTQRQRVPGVRDRLLATAVKLLGERDEDRMSRGGADRRGDGHLLLRATAAHLEDLEGIFRHRLVVGISDSFLTMQASGWGSIATRFRGMKMLFGGSVPGPGLRSGDPGQGPSLGERRRVGRFRRWASSPRSLSAAPATCLD